ncbi:MAG TPA: TonB family protein [Thermoanaerobaculia bacterium]|nr:TonB family protein [Thermoanaerobaculia bacterium]
MKRGDLIRAGPGVSEPVPLDLPHYAYPAAARGSGQKVSVRLALLVDEEGRVVEAIVRKGGPPGLGFGEAAVDAARRTRFQPATRDDIPGKMWTEMILDFAE